MHNAEDIIQLGKASVIQEGSEVAIITTSSMLSVGKKYADKLQEKPYLTEDEELEMKLLKKQKLHYKDVMESLGAELGKK